MERVICRFLKVSRVIFTVQAVSWCKSLTSEIAVSWLRSFGIEDTCDPGLEGLLYGP